MVKGIHIAVLAAFMTLLSTAAAVPQAWIGTGERVRPWAQTGTAERVRLSCRFKGVYRVTAAELATAGGWDATTVSNAITTGELRVECGGESIAWLADAGSLLFFGQPPATLHAPEGVYWVSLAVGTTMPSISTPLPPNGVTNQWFRETITTNGTAYLPREGYSTITNLSYLAFNPLFEAGNLPLAITEASYTFELPAAAPGEWSENFTAHLCSIHYAPGKGNHEAQFSIADTICGTNAWSGEAHIEATWPFTSTALRDNQLKIGIKNVRSIPLLQSDFTRFILISCDITYRRLYQARNDVLCCRDNGDDLIAAYGFSDDNIIVMDVTDPAVPEVIAIHDITWHDDSNSWQATFATQADHLYHLCTAAATLSPAVRGACAIDWHEAPIPQYAIIIPPEAWRSDFRAALQPLVDLRNAQGLRTAIIDVEDLYNSFNHGVVSPWAIRHFCEAAWPRGLRYILLAGGGSLDYQHRAFSVNDYTACLIPTILMGQSFNTGEGMSVPVEALLGDADGDDTPDVAIGRVSTTNPNDLTTVINKIKHFEQHRSGKWPVALYADWQNTGQKYHNFSNGNARLIAPITAARRTYHEVELLYGTSRQENRELYLHPVLQAGASFFHFFGHTKETAIGDVLVQGQGNFLSETQATANNWQHPPVALFMGCRVNRWQSMSTTKRIIPDGTRSVTSGFVAGIGNAGNVSAETCEAFSLSFYNSLTAKPNARRLGDMLLYALRANVNDYRPEELMAMSLYGDPTLIISPKPGTLFSIR